MKFVIAVVILAVVASSQASILPLTSSYIASPISYTAHSLPLAYHQPIISAPIVAAPALVHAEGSYVAANRGSVHVAPLPGHLRSASSINLEPAPGTW